MHLHSAIPLARGMLLKGTPELQRWSPVSTVKQRSIAARLALAGLIFGLLTSASTADAQVGIRSGVAQVTLVARSLPQGTLQRVGGETWTRLDGGLREGSLTLRVSANSGYSLVVRGASQTAGSRTWVRSLNGVFQELTAGSSVTIARHPEGTLNLEQAIEYRVEPAAAGEQALPPVTYELHIAPSL